MNYFKESIFTPLGDYFVEVENSGEIDLDDYFNAKFQHDPSFQINYSKELYRNYGEKELIITKLLRNPILDNFKRDSLLIKKLLLAGVIENLNPEWKKHLKNGIENFKTEILKYEDGINILNLFQNLNFFDYQPINFYWWAYFESQLKNDSLENRFKGVEGEILSFNYEKQYLNILKINQDPEPTFLLNPNAGYDIKSIRKDKKGKEYNIFIEAKYSTDKNNQYFYLSRNEYNVLEVKKQNYLIYYWSKHKSNIKQTNIQRTLEEKNNTSFNLSIIKSEDLIPLSPCDSKASYWEKARFDISNF